MSVENMNVIKPDRYGSQKKSNENRLKIDQVSHKNLIINNIEMNKY